jgi:hypothetical protein
MRAGKPAASLGATVAFVAVLVAAKFGFVLAAPCRDLR